MRGGFHFALIPLCCTLALSACSNGDQKKLERYVEDVKKRGSHRVEPIPQPQPYHRYAYPKSHKRNPFLRVVKRAPMRGQPDLSRPKQELENFALDSLRMVGTVLHDNELWAVISAPDGVVYRVSPGAYMGQNYGKITKVTDKTIEVEESVQTHSGWEKRSVKLGLVEGEG